MTREKALAAMDKFVSMGYGVTLVERDLQDHVHFQDGELTSITRHLEIHAISLDKVDLRAVVEAADELDIDVGWSPVTGNNTLALTDQPEMLKRTVAEKPRRHPR